MGRHLVIQLARVGDFLQTTPLLHRLRRLHPQGMCAILVDRSVAPIARRCPEVDRVLEIDTRALLRDLGQGEDVLQGIVTAEKHCGFLRHARFDTVWILNYSMLAALLGCMVPCTTRRGYWMAPGGGQIMAEPWMTVFQTLVQDGSVIPFNLVDVFCGLCPLGSEPSPAMSYQVHARDRESAARLCGERASPQRPVALQLGTRHPRRSWPIARFAAVASELLRTCAGDLWLLGDVTERPLADAFMRLLHESAGGGACTRVRDFVGRTAITDVPALLENVCLLITADTGTMHIAAAVDCRVLALFTGPARYACTGPWGSGHCILTSRAPCYPCSEDDTSQCDRQCQRAITPDMVATLAGALIADAPVPVPGSTVNLLRAEPDRWGPVYRSLSADDPQEFRTHCYRCMVSAFQHSGDCAAGQGCGARHSIGPHLIEADLAAGCSLLHRAGCDPCALVEARQDGRYRFWHPWIDVHAALRREAAGPAAAAATAMWSDGLRAGVGFLKEYLGEPVECACESAAV